MQATDRIKTIEELNTIGMRLARTPTMQQAFAAHTIAADLASQAPDINLDHLLVSNANQAYALRQQGDYKAAQQLLYGAFEKVQNSTGDFPTYAGRGRVYEELGIVTADFPVPALEPVDLQIPLKIGHIKAGLAYFQEALSFYDKALDTGDEIYSRAQIQQRKLRTIGMRAPKARDLYELVEREEKKSWLAKAVEYATEEVSGREALGETTGQNLANAYHSLGQVLTETVTDTPENYVRARDLFDKVAATPGVHENTLITMNLRKAWLEYRRDPTAAAAIIPLFEVFLADTSALTGADKNALNRKVVELGTLLGGDYVEKVRGFYQG